MIILLSSVQVLLQLQIKEFKCTIDIRELSVLVFSFVQFKKMMLKGKSYHFQYSGQFHFKEKALVLERVQNEY